MKAVSVGFATFARAGVSSAPTHVRPAGRLLLVLRFVGLAVYALFLVAAPFEHDDLWCELKAPQHCISCRSSVVGSNPAAPATLDASCLTDAGKAVSVLLLSDGVVLPARSTGRSPPITA
jgi:hypothetical protein